MQVGVCIFDGITTSIYHNKVLAMVSSMMDNDMK